MDKNGFHLHNSKLTMPTTTFDTSKESKDYGNNFRRFRIKFIDKVQARAAEKLGISRGHLSSLESGRHRPSLELFERLIRDYNLNVDWLPHGLGDMQTTGPAKPTAATSLSQAHTEIEVMQKSMRILHSQLTTLFNIIEKQQKQIDELTDRLNQSNR